MNEAVFSKTPGSPCCNRAARFRWALGPGGNWVLGRPFAALGRNEEDTFLSFDRSEWFLVSYEVVNPPLTTSKLETVLACVLMKYNGSLGVRNDTLSSNWYLDGAWFWFVFLDLKLQACFVFSECDSAVDSGRVEGIQLNFLKM